MLIIARIEQVFEANFFKEDGSNDVVYPHTLVQFVEKERYHLGWRLGIRWDLWRNTIDSYSAWEVVCFGNLKFQADRSFESPYAVALSLIHSLKGFPDHLKRKVCLRHCHNDMLPSRTLS